MKEGKGRMKIHKRKAKKSKSRTKGRQGTERKKKKQDPVNELSQRTADMEMKEREKTMKTLMWRKRIKVLKKG